MADKWDIYDYHDHRDKNMIEDWLVNDLQVPERARMIRKLDALRDNGPELFGCTERDRAFVPANAIARALENRAFVIADSKNRRKLHEFEDALETPTEK